jgi:preprotein translocase subunit SecG
MGVVYGFLILVEVLVSALLIVVIFMQKTKGGMGGSAFGGGAGEAIFGSRMGNVLTKATVMLGVIFLVNTILLTVLTSRRSVVTESVMDGVTVAPPAVQQQPALPQGPDMAGWLESEMGAETPFTLEVPPVVPQIDGEEILVVAPAEVSGAEIDPEPATELPAEEE